MENITIKGIVIGSIDYKESSKIVYLYTANGRISVKALGAKRPKKGLLPFITTLNFVEATITSSEFPTLIDFTLINDFNKIKEDLKSSLWFSYMAEILNKVDKPSLGAFDFVLELFNEGERGVNPLYLDLIFQTKMLYLFGVKPIFKKCVICNNTNVKYFSIKNAGALCDKHYIDKSYDKDILDILTKLYYFDFKLKDYSMFLNIDSIKVFNIISLYYENYVNIYLKGLSSLIF